MEWIGHMFILNLFALSFSFNSKNEIEFRNTENLNTILTYSVGPHQPGVLCAVSTEMLVYENRAINPRQLHWLDCSEPEPKLLGISANTNLTLVKDMCTVKLENETLFTVISYDRDKLIHAYNSTTGQLKWSVQKKIPSGTFNSYGVAGDGNGRLFVADYNNKCIQMFTASNGRLLVTDYNNKCIQMFSASNGQYLGCFMKQGDQGLGVIWSIRWCVSTSSLVVSHCNAVGKYLISDIH